MGFCANPAVRWLLDQHTIFQLAEQHACFEGARLQPCHKSRKNVSGFSRRGMSVQPCARMPHICAEPALSEAAHTDEPHGFPDVGFRAPQPHLAPAIPRQRDGGRSPGLQPGDTPSPKTNGLEPRFFLCTPDTFPVIELFAGCPISARCSQIWDSAEPRPNAPAIPRQRDGGRSPGLQPGEHPQPPIFRALAPALSPDA